MKKILEVFKNTTDYKLMLKLHNPTDTTYHCANKVRLYRKLDFGWKFAIVTQIT